jgi:hypothetical protein
MVLINRAQAGNTLMQLFEQASPLYGDFFAPSFYFACTHVGAPWLTYIAFMGRDRGHATRQFERRLSNRLAEIEEIEGDT